MIQPAFEILNQRGTPMFFSDVYANIPTAGIVGRIFISTDTKEFYRDTGSTWELIGGPGSGTVTGSGTAGQVTYWNGASTITGSNTLFWDNTNAYLFIGTNTSSFAFGHKIRAVGQADASIGIFRNQATASPAKLEFFKSRGTYAAPTANSANDQLMNIAAFGWGTASTQYVNAAAITAIAEGIGATGIQGRLNFQTYNSSAGNLATMCLRNSGSAPGSGGTVTIAGDSFNTVSAPQGTIHLRGFDSTALNNNLYIDNNSGTQLFTLNNVGQGIFGTSVSGTGRLIVNNSTSDAHLQIIGANGPSIRIDNAGTGSATQRFVMGLATATNNFIQGSAAGNICISTASSGPMLFGMWQTINASEVMRISTANNLLVGTSVDAGFKVDISGKLRSSASIATPTLQSDAWSYGDGFGNIKTITTQGVVAGTHIDCALANGYSGTSNQTHLGLSNFSFAPTSGTGRFIGLSLAHTINQTGTATGITRGIYVNPILTAAADWRAIEISSGGVYVNTTTVQASAILQADSTTKGFLPPRMTTAQINAIVSPAEGLVVYNTTLSHLCCYQAGAWVKFSHSPM